MRNNIKAWNTWRKINLFVAILVDLTFFMYYWIEFRIVSSIHRRLNRFLRMAITWKRKIEMDSMDGAVQLTLVILHVTEVLLVEGIRVVLRIH